MAKRAFKNNVKKYASILTLATIFMGTTISVLPTKDANAAEQEVTKSTKRNVMYYGDWSIWGGEGNFYPKDIPAEDLTHLNFAFLDFDSNGNLQFTDKDSAIGAPVGEPGVQWEGPNAGCINAFQELRAKNPNLKIGISVGGWSKSGDFTEVCSNPTKRATLAKNLAKFVEYANMDFVDIDWEYPAEARQPDLIDNRLDEGTPAAIPEDKQNYIKFLEDLRVELDKKEKEISKDFEISVALPAPKSKIDSGINVKALFDVVDFANVMTYDMRGAWDETSGHQTALYPNPKDPTNGAGLSVDESVDYLISQGAAPEKIVVGAAYYTRGWDNVSAGSDASLPGLFGDASVSNKDADGTPSKGAINEAPMKPGEGGRAGGVWAHRSKDKLKSTFPGLKEYWDDTAKAPYMYDESTGKFFTYDNEKSITEKTKYINENNLGGMIAWMASQDAPTNSSKRDELTKATRKGLYGNDKLPEHEIVYSDLDIECSIKPVKEAWGTGGGYEIIITNKEKKEESGEVLSLLERSHETIKTPILYIDADIELTAGDHMAGVVSKENGITIVDIKKVWEGKNIEQGQSYKFMLNAPSAPEDISAIKSIDIGQRTNEEGTVIAKQRIFGEGNDGDIIPPTNAAPTLKGVTDKTITVGDKFDPLFDVTAFDKEDGDLTKSITLTGTVDISKAGKYTLNYTVKDSKGLEATATRVITVVDGELPPTPPNPSDTFDPTKIYLTGDTVIYNGKTYVAKYWTQGSTPDKSDAWELKVEANSDGSLPYTPGKSYNSGEIVSYNGEKYKAAWWTTSIPGSDSSWTKL